jgi:HD-like signal output (HDOD) protein
VRSPPMTTISFATILAGIDALEPMPLVAARVLELSAEPEVVPTELCSLIRTDAALCARVLKLCNSAYFGCPREITSLEEAGIRLGVDRLASLVLTSCAGRWFHGDRGRPDDAEARWRRTVTNALAARLIARLGREVEPERAYTAGLLQDLGTIVIERELAFARPALADLRTRGFDELEAERELFGVDHAWIGARLVDRWGLPEVLVDAIRWHHAPELARCDPALAGAVHLGGVLASRLAELEPSQADGRALERAMLDEQSLLALAEPLEGELVEARELLDC